MKHIGITRITAAALTVALALALPLSAQARGGGFHGGAGFHGGGGFHDGGGFHGGGFHSSAFHGAGGFGHTNFGGGGVDHWHNRGFGDWGWGDAWTSDVFPDYDDDGDAYDGAIVASPSPQYWYYCQNPAGYFPNVTSCTTAWQTVPAG